MWFSGLRSQYAKKLRELQDKHFNEVTGLNESNHKLRMENEDLKAKHIREITSLKHEIGLAKEKFDIEMEGTKATAETEVERLKLTAEKEIEIVRGKARDEVLEQIRDALETKAGSATQLLNLILQKIPTYRGTREEYPQSRPRLIGHKGGKDKKKK